MKKHFTNDQHIAAGQLLKTIHNQLVAFEVEVGRAYKKNGPEKTNTLAAINAINRVRSELEDRMFEEGHIGADVSVYYGEAKQAILPDLIEKTNAVHAEISEALVKVIDAINGCEDTKSVAKASAAASDLRDIVNAWPWVVA